MLWRVFDLKVALAVLLESVILSSGFESCVVIIYISSFYNSLTKHTVIGNDQKAAHVYNNITLNKKTMGNYGMLLNHTSEPLFTDLK